jgi:purine-nucleoside/S-methyl-5'-thioadenosine phosphorylase / adenosine deaminase
MPPFSPSMATAVTDLPPPFEWAETHITADLPHGRVLFSTRHGGISTGPFASLNLGLLTADDPVNVDENRRRLAGAVGLARERFVYGRQVHGATVRRATAPPGPARPRADEDGQATALTDAAALVFVADCLPILLTADGAVAALHGGWRGLADGIVAEGVAALRELGAAGPVTAALGPAARGCCYEVGEEVHARFPISDARANGHLDLAAVATRQLEQAGVDTVHDVGLCTMCEPDLLFSHRRSGGTTGRQAGVVWRA